jgi:hypothetical protein
LIALAILVMSLAILLQVQANAAVLTREAERMVTATDLAHLKYDEAVLSVEQKGFQVGDLYENGDFKDMGDAAAKLEFGKELEDYHWEYSVNEIDIQLASDLMGAATEVQGSGMFGGGASADGAAPPPLDAEGGGLGALGSLGVSGDMFSQLVGPYIREVRVRVYWGDDSDKAKENGEEVEIVGHIINPSGQILQLGAAGAAGDAAQPAATQ